MVFLRWLLASVAERKNSWRAVGHQPLRHAIASGSVDRLQFNHSDRGFDRCDYALKTQLPKWSYGKILFSNARTMMERTDGEWVASLKSSNSEAINDLRAFLVRGLTGGLRGKADSNLIDDFAQETVLKVLAGLESYRGQGRLLTWALAIGMRVAYSELRRARYKDVSLSDIEAAGRTAMEPADAHQKTMDSAQRQSILIKLRELIATILTPRQREAILAELDGVPQVVIADRLGTNRNALYKLGHDARVKLKRGLMDAGISVDDVRELIAGAS